MLIRFLTRGRERGLKLKLSNGLRLKRVLYNEARRIAHLQSMNPSTLFINHSHAHKVLAARDEAFFKGIQWNN